jgi:hypothetical protein
LAVASFCGGGGCLRARLGPFGEAVAMASSGGGWHAEPGEL